MSVGILAERLRLFLTEKAENLLLAQDSSKAEVFDKFYRNGRWGRDASGRGISGRGSTPEITAEYREFIEGFIREKQVESIVDAGCGDWGFSKLIDWNHALYIGVDVSRVVIDWVSEQHQDDATHFMVGDIAGELPGADLLISKDTLQHMPNGDIARFVSNNLKPGKYRWALIVNDVAPSGVNTDIPVGHYRPVDLRKPPFDLQGIEELDIAFGSEKKKKVHLLSLSLSCENHLGG